MEKEQTLRGKTRQTDKSSDRNSNNSNIEEKNASPEYLTILSMLDAASAAMLGQLSSKALLRTAGSLGNQAVLAAVSARSEKSDTVHETAAILGGASVPRFLGDAPENSVIPQADLGAASVPDFGFFGGRPAGFEAVYDIAMGLNG